MEPVNEKSTPTLSLSFKDQDGAPVVPSGASWRIDDPQGGEIRGDTAFVPSGATHDLVLAVADTTILDPSHPREIRVVTVTFQYGVGRQGTAFYRFQVINLLGIS